MNRQDRQRSATESQAKPRAQSTGTSPTGATPTPPEFPPLGWIQVIRQPDRETQELAEDHTLNAAALEVALDLHVA